MPTTIPVEQLGDELRRYREENELSLRDVQTETGISPSTLSRIERGHVPDLEKVRALAELLEVNVSAAGSAADSLDTDADFRRAVEVHLRAKKDLSEDVAKRLADAVESILRSADDVGDAADE